ncbi:hypothetical protein ACQ4LE_002893 [Meloidogyne hapla]|uniref:PAS domain-containing protein n=1 Tax=Meloidogyne hapla TaxID=6305 RepID=A0A1I8BYA8_MELHA
MLSYSNTCIISTIPLNENEELNKNKIEQQQQLLVDEQFKDCDSPQSGSVNFNVITDKSLNNSNYIGTLFISLPDGIIIECQQNICLNSSEEENSSENSLNKILKIGDSLFNYLYGKGTQTMLLNAFCGHSRRRMYARIKWGNDNIRACELLCEFSNDPKNSSRRLANIQLFRVQNIDIKQQKQLFKNNLIFTTRHNSFCSIIYFDSTSIPLLGHFPSEVTGKSLFTIVHPEDAHLIKDAHQKLHSQGGTQIVKSSGIRLLTYSGDSVLIDSEWAAFVNPWTKNIEMVVGRHTFNISQINSSINTNEGNNLKDYSNRDKQAKIVQTILAEPVKDKEQNQSELISPTISSFLIQQQNQQNNNLSYNQINCLENVHRLLKSQSNSGTEEDNKSLKNNSNIKEDIKLNNNILLTKELLLKHNQRWEEECRDNWNKKLSSKIYLKRKLIKDDEEDILKKQIKCENIIKKNYENFIENSLNSTILPLKRKYSNNSIYNSQKYFAQEISEILNCLQQKNKKEIPHHQQQNQQLIKQINNNNNLKQNSELIEQLLQAANIARNTLAIKLLQKDLQKNNSSQQINNYIKEYQFI